MSVGEPLSVIDPALPVDRETPLAAAWESIRSGLRRDCGARTFDGWLKPAELGSFEPDAKSDGCEGDSPKEG